MSALDDKIDTIQTLLGSLTWRKIALLTTFLAIVGFSYALFDNRYSVYEFFGSNRVIPSATILKLSKSSIDSINLANTQSANIIAIQITLVDFQRNTRTITYTSVDNQELKALYGKFMEKAPTELPLFNSDIINNQRLVNLVNGEFICTPYKDTLSAKLVPESVSFVNTLCAGPVPPLYGRFTGIISIYLIKEPSATEIELVRILSRNLGLLVYNNDLR
jgi:hypothetical protein